jgi:hypothetical protein
MLRLLADENFNGDIVRALLLRQPDLNIVRVQDVGLVGVVDPDILPGPPRTIELFSRTTVRPYLITRMNAWPLRKSCRAFSS